MYEEFAINDEMPVEERRGKIVDLLLHVRDTRPDLFDMSSWSVPRGECGTAHCVAGWVAVAHEDADEQAVRMKNGDWMNYYVLGRDMLSLTEGQADELFYNMEQTIDEAVAFIKDAPIHEP